jgi:hypothetical protein
MTTIDVVSSQGIIGNSQDITSVWYGVIGEHTITYLSTTRYILYGCHIVSDDTVSHLESVYFTAADGAFCTKKIWNPE